MIKFFLLHPHCIQIKKNVHISIQWNQQKPFMGRDKRNSIWLYQSIILAKYAMPKRHLKSLLKQSLVLFNGLSSYTVPRRKYGQTMEESSKLKIFSYSILVKTKRSKCCVSNTKSKKNFMNPITLNRVECVRE